MLGLALLPVVGFSSVLALSLFTLELDEAAPCADAASWSLSDVNKSKKDKFKSLEACGSAAREQHNFHNN